MAFGIGEACGEFTRRQLRHVKRAIAMMRRTAQLLQCTNRAFFTTSIGPLGSKRPDDPGRTSSCVVGLPEARSFLLLCGPRSIRYLSDKRALLSDKQFKQNQRKPNTGRRCAAWRARFQVIHRKGSRGESL